MSLLVQGACRLICLLPVRLAGALGAGGGRIAFYLTHRRRDIALRNVARIYPERSRAWRKRIARESFAEMGRSILEIPHVFLRSSDFLQSRVHVEGLEDYQSAMRKGKGAFVLFYHHANWELCGIFSSTQIPNIHCIYRAIRQDSLERFVKQCRERFGATMHPRQEGLRWMPRALKWGHSVFILIDQHLSNGMPVPFLGHLANTSTAPAPFVARHGVPVFGLALHRIGRSFRFRMQLKPIEMPEPSGDKSADAWRIMDAINKSFDPMIHQRPELWLWSHQRWKLLEEDNRDITEVVHGTP